MLNRRHNDCCAVRVSVVVDGNQTMPAVRPNVAAKYRRQLYDEPADLGLPADLVYAKPGDYIVLDFLRLEAE